MEPNDRVDLAHAPGFTLGRLSVRPAVRQLVRDDGAEEVLQHRVMQVLIALARVDGAIVTRDELTMSCWDGRVVGEDAINRILSRLRAVAADIGAGSFRIETITRIGYRLLREGQEAPEDGPVAVEEAAPAAGRPSRRLFLLGGAALAAAGGTGLFFLLRRPADETAVPPEVAALWARAMTAMRQATAEGNGQAIGLLRQIVERAPDFADGWAALGLGYAWSYSGRGGRNDESTAERARAAIRRARQLDPDSAYATMAEVLMTPMIGHWAERERVLRAAVAIHPRSDGLLNSLGWTLSQVGRWTDAAPPLIEAVRLDPLTPGPRYPRAIALWGANRLEEAEAAYREDVELFPTHFASWFGRVDFLVHAGRYGEALAIVEDRTGRPPGIPTVEFEESIAFIHAMQSRGTSDVDAVMRRAIEKAHQATGYAEIAIKYGSMLGRLEDAFAVAEALFFGRGFEPGNLRYSAEQAIYSPRRDHRTHFLFLPNMTALRADSRFAQLVNEIGLTRYWQETGTRPDYQRG